MLNLSDFVYIFTRVSDIYLSAEWNIPDNQFCYDANVHRSACLMHTVVCVIDDGLMCCYTETITGTMQWTFLLYSSSDFVTFKQLSLIIYV